MISKNAYAKVNIGLDVLRKRADQYHEVRMIMQTINLADELTFEKAGEGIDIVTNCKELINPQSNLVYKAAKLLLETCHISEGVKIVLHKKIPMAAGLAGGSADAAATFLGLRDLFQIQITDDELKRMAVQIGADVPYCIMGGTALAEGIGEILTKLTKIPNAPVLIAKPAVDVSTAFVYGRLHLGPDTVHPDIDAQLEGLREQNLHKIIGNMGNVLESVTAPAYPVITEIENDMKRMGAMNAMMSGSGPTVFGIFPDTESRDLAYGMIKEHYNTAQVFRTEFLNK